jgi:hypothetical protein
VGCPFSFGGPSHHGEPLTSPSPSATKKLISTWLPLALSVIISELALQLACRLFTDQDANGFHKPAVPEPASILALGDSNSGQRVLAG